MATDCAAAAAREIWTGALLILNHELEQPMNLTSHLTRSERIERIGQILAKGVGLLLTRESEKERLAESTASTCDADHPRLHSPDQHDVGGAIVLDGQEQRILDYLKRKPDEIGTGMSFG